ncbi:MAG TPA: DUF3667 domain-containing protein [Caulobacteraceae bacterium]|nr:DUF3667 domain-containing protein [Caulobacteraceae bacterium]
MARELELVAAASIAAEGSPHGQHLRAVGSPCANCGTTLEGPYCHACGQLAEDFDQRSLVSLVGEGLENLFHADGRLWRTLPRLAFRPAGLTRDYLAGKRASQLPPLRLFLVAILLVFLAGGIVRAAKPHTLDLRTPTGSSKAINLEFNGRPAPFQAWLNPRVQYAIAHPRELESQIEGGLHNLAILFLPIATVLLCLLFPFSRRFKVYDHAIFSMHSLSFVGLLFTVITLTDPLLPISVLALAAPVHLFAHMRGVYRTGVLGTVLRMALLFLLSCIAFGVAMLVLVLLGLNALGTS